MRRRLTTLSTRRDRATIGVFGMAALTFVLAMTCGTVLLRSLDSYKASADLESRLQARAAAEGAVVALLAAQGKPPQQEIEIGTSRVRFLPSDTQTSASQVRFRVEVFRNPSRPVLSLAYRAQLSPQAPGAWQLEKLEAEK